MRKVGFVGLGNMGKGMCKNLILKGNDVSVYDLSKKAMEAFSDKATLCNSATEVLKRSEVVFLSLPNSDIIEATVDEFLKEDVRGKIIVDTSTAFPVSTRALHKKLKEAGAGLVDSPLISGPQEADAGTLVAVAAGDREDVESVHELLMSYCTKYDYVGASGNGHLIKLAQNFSGLTQALLYAEIFPIMERYGISPEETYKVFDNDVFNNWVFRFYGEKYVKKEYRMDFAMKLGLKDLTYMKRLFDNINVPAFLLDGAIDLLRVSLKEGEGKLLDFSHAGETMYDYVKERK